MSRKKKKNYMANPSNPWIAVNTRGIPERKDKQIRQYLTRSRCEDYIKNRPGIRLIAIRLKDLDVANIMAE